MSRYLRLFGLVLSLFSVMISPAQAAKRVALVVGNDDYQSLPKLQKAVNDARAVSEALAELGFEVIAGENLSRRDMNRKLADLERAIAPGDQVFFFYAGHGVALGAENYLLPVDMPAPEAGEDGLVRNEGHAADAIIRAIQRRGAGVSFVVLDACRNNPFEASGTRDVGLSRGLSRIDAPAGVFVLFSAGIGQTALDRLSNADGDPNSVFTRKLVPLLRTPGLSHVDLAKELQQEVSELAATIQHTQEPAYYDQVIGRVVLKEGEKVAADKSATPEISTLAEQVKQLQDELARQKAEKGAAVAVASPDVTALAEQVKQLQEELALRKLEAEEDQQVALLQPPLAPTADPSSCATLLVKVGAKDQCLAPGDVFRDSAVAPEMVVLPPGTFTMGSPSDELDRSTAANEEEDPPHDVTIARSFAVGKFELTRGQFEAFVTATGYKTGGSCWIWNETEWKDTAGKSWRDPGFAQTDDHPVACVSWDDAKAYVTWLATETGQDYRLLSESEWEYAIRGQTQAGSYPRYHFGNDASDLCGYANGWDKTTDANMTCSDGVGSSTAPAGRYKPNAFGLYDMHGNVWEWTEDCWERASQVPPDDGTPVTTADCSRRVGRGGSWGNVPGYLRSASRNGIFSGYAFVYVGFRLARTLSP